VAWLTNGPAFRRKPAQSVSGLSPGGGSGETAENRSATALSDAALTQKAAEFNPQTDTQGINVLVIERCWAERWGDCFLVNVKLRSGQSLRHVTAFSSETAAKALTERVVARGWIQPQFWRG
jgi:hypothetical protein